MVTYDMYHHVLIPHGGKMMLLRCFVCSMKMTPSLPPPPVHLHPKIVPSTIQINNSSYIFDTRVCYYYSHHTQSADTLDRSLRRSWRRTHYNITPHNIHLRNTQCSFGEKLMYDEGRMYNFQRLFWSTSRMVHMMRTLFSSWQLAGNHRCRLRRRWLSMPI